MLVLLVSVWELPSPFGVKSFSFVSLYIWTSETVNLPRCVTALAGNHGESASIQRFPYYEFCLVIDFLPGTPPPGPVFAGPPAPHTRCAGPDCLLPAAWTNARQAWFRDRSRRIVPRSRSGHTRAVPNRHSSRLAPAQGFNRDALLAFSFS